jgi:hypothetical protein
MLLGIFFYISLFKIKLYVKTDVQLNSHGHAPAGLMLLSNFSGIAKL